MKPFVMGETKDLWQARSCRQGGARLPGRLVLRHPIPGRSLLGYSARALALSAALVAVPHGSSIAQTNELAASIDTAPDTASEVVPATEQSAFGSQFVGAITPLGPDLSNIDLAIPETAVDLDSFEPPIEEGPSVVRDLGIGVASYYGRRFHGRLTANGERFNMNAMTAAHKTLPFGTRVRVTNPRNGRSVVVRINDRGPFIKGRTIDLSRGAATQIGMIARGHARVELEVVR